MVTDSNTHNDENRRGWQDNVIAFFEQLSNFAFYTLALFIILIPPIKWVADKFPSTDNGWWVLASISVFVIIIPLLTELVANVSIIPLEKIRKGEFLSVIFKPLKSIFAVVSIYGVMVLEYKVIHGQTDKTLLEVYFELLKAF